GPLPCEHSAPRGPTPLLSPGGWLPRRRREAPPLPRRINGAPMIIVDQGRPLEQRPRPARLTAEQVLESARHLHGLERMEDIKFAIFEANGKISIIPYPRAATAEHPGG